MAGFLTSDGADFFLNLFANGETAPPNFYLALITGNQPGLGIHGNELDEPAPLEYSRGQITNTSGSWSLVNGTLTNVATITFPVASVSWGTVSYWAICDNAKGGRVLWAGDCYPIPVDAGGQVVFTPGTLSIGFDLDSWKKYT